MDKKTVEVHYELEGSCLPGDLKDVMIAMQKIAISYHVLVVFEPGEIIGDEQILKAIFIGGETGCDACIAQLAHNSAEQTNAETMLSEAKKNVKIIDL